MRKNAFTLAEVLITLVIVGVIAAMTIPTLMGNTNKKEVTTRLKKSFAAINQAVALDYALYGNTPGRALGREGLARVLQNHLSVIEGQGELVFKTADGMVFNLSGSDGIGFFMDYDPNNQNRSGIQGQCAARAQEFEDGSVSRTFVPTWCDVPEGFGPDFLYN